MLTYIISGYIRSGTSMVMQALKAGGIDIAFSEERERVNQRLHHSEGYEGNPKGFYELTADKRSEPGYPSKYFGGAVKELLPPFGSPTGIAPGDYTVIVMRRSPNEINESARRSRIIPDSEDHSIIDTFWPCFYHMVGALQQRRDMDVKIWDYSKVVADPLPYFEELASIDARLDPSKSASVIDEKLYRNRKVA